MVHTTTYYTATDATDSSAGGIAGLVSATYVQQGTSGTPIQQTATNYFALSAGGATADFVASETVYSDEAGLEARTTAYGYTWYTGSTAVKTRTATLPTVTEANNGSGTADAVTTEYLDSYGRTIWSKDPLGHVSYAAYDVKTGALVKSIADVNYASLSSGEQTSFDATGWTHPSGLHLVTTSVVDDQGRTTKLTDPNGNITFTIFDDANHQVTVFGGWNSSTHTTTGPIWVAREDRAHKYSETLTTTASASYNASNEPTGLSTALSSSNIGSLSRTILNDAGQAVYADAYFSLAGATYSAGSTTLGTVGTNYYRTETAYDDRGRVKRVLNPIGTITRFLYDARGNQTQTWIGTDDTPTSGYWSPSNTSGTDLTLVSENEYDRGAVGGDGNLTSTTVHPTSSTYRKTLYAYDWRDRLAATKSGVDGNTESTSDNTHPITYATYDNLGEQTSLTGYDGDTEGIYASGDTLGYVGSAPSGSLRRSYGESSFDEWGRTFESRTFGVDASTGDPSTDPLRSDSWYNSRGDLIKSSQPGGVVTKNNYDGAGRLSKSYITDGGGDANPGDTGNWSDANDVSGDKVLEQSAYTYDANGNLILTATKQRFHDATDTGELGDPSSSSGTAKARVYYSAAYYDAADRLTDAVDVGTNPVSGTSTAYTRPSSVPSRSDAALVTSYSYNSAGQLQQVTDPRGIITQNAYDLLGRTTSTIAGYVDGTPSDSDDQTTLYTYDGMNHVLTMTADMPGTTPDQVTQYVYGVTTGGGSSINSDDLLKEVRYPDKSTGAAGTASSDKQQYLYNALGEPTQLTDQNGNVHQYSYDVLGRQTADAVTTLGSGVDGTVRRLETSYNTQGLPEKFTSYDASSSGSVVNQVQRVYNGLGQLTTEYQEHSGAVNTSTSPKVQYTYTEMASGANNSRLTSMTYPNGRVLHYAYASGLDDSISRLSYLADDNGSGGIGTHLEEYSYLGLGTIVRAARPEPGTELTYIASSNGDAGDKYAGLDRFGRIVDQRWMTTSGSTDLDRFQYGYDRDGNPLYKNNTVQGSLSELYHANSAASADDNSGYDKLNRLTEFRRGTLTSSSNNGSGLDTVTTGNLSSLTGATRTWTLDAIGNQTATSTDGTSESNTLNSGNQLTSTPSWSYFVYDGNGNLLNDPTDRDFHYDAWNRLTHGPIAGGTEESPRDVMLVYDALGRRVSLTNSSVSNNIDPESNTGSYYSFYSAESLYYSAGWQVVQDDGSSATESYNGEGFDEEENPVFSEVTSDSSTGENQYVWGQTYIDDLVLRDRDADNSTETGSFGKSGSGLEERLYAQHDANHNVTSLTDATGSVQERFVYDAYGSVTVLSAGGSTTSDSYVWSYLHQGTRYVSELGLYDVRNRFYSPTLGRWMQEDPAFSSMNLYEAFGSRPLSLVDPRGLQATQPGEVIRPGVNAIPYRPLSWADFQQLPEGRNGHAAETISGFRIERWSPVRILAKETYPTLEAAWDAAKAKLTGFSQHGWWLQADPEPPRWGANKKHCWYIGLASMEGVRVQTYFSTSSWTVQGTDDPELLRHEQGHLDITHLFGNGLEDALNSFRVAFVSWDAKRALDGAFALLLKHARRLEDEYRNDERAAQVRYDKETNHGLNDRAQQRWNSALANGELG